MDNKINRLVISVIVTVMLVFISVPLWNLTSKTRSDMLANSYGDLSITVNIGTFPELVVIEDDRAIEYLNDTPVIFRNPNDKSKKFKMHYLVDKKSTIDYKDIVVSINDNIYHIKDLEKIEDNDNYYFLLSESSLGAYSDKTYHVRIWLDENTSSVSEDMILISNFIAI